MYQAGHHRPPRLVEPQAGSGLRAASGLRAGSGLHVGSGLQRLRSWVAAGCLASGCLVARSTSRRWIVKTDRPTVRIPRRARSRARSRRRLFSSLAITPALPPELPGSDCLAAWRTRCHRCEASLLTTFQQIVDRALGQRICTVVL